MESVRGLCPTCRGPLRCVCALQLRGRPHGERGHELVYHREALFECVRCGRGQLEKFDHDCFDLFDPWDLLSWHELDPADMCRLAEDLKACTRATWPGCECRVHRALRESAKLLRMQIWPGGAGPRWADEEVVRRCVAPAALHHTRDGLPVVIAKDPASSAAGSA